MREPTTLHSVDRRGFFKSLLGKGLTQGVRQVDAVVIPFERAAKAARAALPIDEELDADATADLALVPEGEAELDPLGERTPLPARPVTATCALEDLMRLAADAGLIRHVEAVCALSRRTVRLVPGDADAPVGRSRFGGAPDLPDDVPWPTWDEQPLTFLCQIDLAEAAAVGIDELLPPEGLLLVFAAAGRMPSGTSPLDTGSCRVIPVPGDRVPAAGATVAPDGAAGPSLPDVARPMALSSELTIPRVWDPIVRALGLDAEEQRAWEQVRRQLAELQGVEAWDAGGELHARHHLLGYPDDTRDDMELACELVARGVDIGYAPARSHPEARGLDGVAQRWRLLVQLTIDDELGWRFGSGRERLFAWAPEDDLREGETMHAHAITR